MPRAPSASGVPSSSRQRLWPPCAIAWRLPPSGHSRARSVCSRRGGAGALSRLASPPPDRRRSASPPDRRRRARPAARPARRPARGPQLPSSARPSRARTATRHPRHPGQPRAEARTFPPHAFTRPAPPGVSPGLRHAHRARRRAGRGSHCRLCTRGVSWSDDAPHPPPAPPRRASTRRRSPAPPRRCCRWDCVARASRRGHPPP